MSQVLKEGLEAQELISQLLEPLNADERRLLMEHMTLTRYEKEGVIHAKGDVPTHLKCLLRGKIKVVREGIGRSQIVRMIRPVEYFGYRAYFAGESYANFAVAVEPSLVCQVPMNIVERMVEGNIRLARFFIKDLSTRLGEADRRTISLTQKHIRGRLAESLLLLMDSYGIEEDGYTLSIYLSREDLANLSNMTTSNAIRTLSQFASEQIVTVDGRKIKLIDVPRLRQISLNG